MTTLQEGVAVVAPHRDKREVKQRPPSPLGASEVKMRHAGGADSIISSEFVQSLCESAVDLMSS